MTNWTRRVFCLALGACLLAALSAGCRAEDARVLEARSAYEFVEKNRGRDDFLILDVRTPAEYGRGHIAGAVLMDYYRPDFADRFAALDRNSTILLYCHSGSRSGDVLALSEKLGFGKVYELQGGIVSWMRAGLPLSTDGAN